MIWWIVLTELQSLILKILCGKKNMIWWKALTDLEKLIIQLLDG